MHSIKTAGFAPALAFGLLATPALSTALSAATYNIPPVGITARKSGNDLILSFRSVSPGLYTLQTSADLQQPWTTIEPGLMGDGSVKTVTLTNALLNGEGFYRLLIQSPTRLVLSQGAATAILGHWCGGIQERVYVTGFDPATGNPIGEVYLSTSCSTGHGSPPANYSAWAGVTWDLAGNELSSGALTNAVTINANFIASDGLGDTIFNAAEAAYLVVPIPAVPVSVNAVQSGDQFQISWTPNGVNPAAVTSSILTATPINSTAPVLTTTVTGAATTGIIPTLQPQTTYQVSVVNTTIAGYSPVSLPVSVTTEPASIPPSAPTGVAAHWAVIDPTGTNDTLVATWQAAVPGDSPVDQYRITIAGSDSGGTFTQMVSGTTLTAYFSVDFIPNWSVTVQAHNAVGWGPSSSPVTLGGL